MVATGRDEEGVPSTMAWLRQVVIFRASPDVLFDTSLSARKHAAATRAEAVMSRKVGGKFTAPGGTSGARMWPSCRSA